MTSIALMLVAPLATAEQPHLLGGVAAGTYGDLVRTEIDDFALIHHPPLASHPHEVVVGALPDDALIRCELYDNTGTVAARAEGFARGGPTRIYFTDHVPQATARCGTLRSERRTRPSTGGVVVNRLMQPPDREGPDQPERPTSGSVVVNRLTQPSGGNVVVNRQVPPRL